MLDALIADDISERPGGVRARCGSLVLSVDCPERDREHLIALEAPAVIWAQLEARDEEFMIAGFSSHERRELYRALRRIPGIGRRSALAVLDCGEELDILRAVAAKDAAFFRSVPGLGAKRIGAVIGELASRYEGALPQPLAIPVAWFVEARDGLRAAGVGAEEAERRLARVLSRARPSSAEELFQAAREGEGP